MPSTSGGGRNDVLLVSLSELRRKGFVDIRLRKPYKEHMRLLFLASICSAGSHDGEAVRQRDCFGGITTVLKRAPLWSSRFWRESASAAIFLGTLSGSAPGSILFCLFPFTFVSSRLRSRAANTGP